jgi:hypothetical protein
MDLVLPARVSDLVADDNIELFSVRRLAVSRISKLDPMAYFMFSRLVEVKSLRFPAHRLQHQALTIFRPENFFT